MTVSPNRAPRWTEDLSALLFGIHEPKKKDAAAIYKKLHEQYKKTPTYEKNKDRIKSREVE